MLMDTILFRPITFLILIIVNLSACMSFFEIHVSTA